MIDFSKKLIGNKELVDKLIYNFNSKTLSNSIILTGEKGIGKATLTFHFINKIYHKNLQQMNVQTATRNEIVAELSQIAFVLINNLF